MCRCGDEPRLPLRIMSLPGFPHANDFALRLVDQGVLTASMEIKAVAFDVNGTLVQILTDDGMDQIFRSAAHFLSYQGIDLRRDQVRDLYFQIMKEQQRTSTERYPEFDAVGIWRRIIDGHQTDFTRRLPAEKLEQMPLFLAEMSRGISRHRLSLFPHVREVLDVLRERYSLAVVTDAQSAYARSELYKVGLLDYFDPIIVSGDHRYRKPDRRLFQLALDGMKVAAENALYVGNDMHCDIFGAREVGMTTVMFDSQQGTKVHLDCVPDYTITDFRDLLKILDCPTPSGFPVIAQPPGGRLAE
jgi:putative hydrolase of the HAD superfamily